MKPYNSSHTIFAQNWTTAMITNKINENANADVKSAKDNIIKPAKTHFFLLHYYGTHNELDNHKVVQIFKITYSKL